MPDNSSLMDTISRRPGALRLDTLCLSLARCVSKAEAYETAGDNDRLGFQLEIIEERLHEIAAVRDALLAAKGDA